MIRPYEQHEREIIAIQEANPTEEVCGVLTTVNGCFNVVQLKNEAVDKSRVFSMDIGQYLETAKIAWHTHALPESIDGVSDPDKYFASISRLPVCVYVKRTGKFHYWKPGDYHPSIIGRPWCPEIFDCFALIRDALFEFWDVQVPDLNRTFLHAFQGLERVDEYWRSAGFEMVHKSAVGRIALINYQGSKFVNHLALFVTEHSVLHQLRGNPAKVDFFSDIWRRQTFYFVRHPLVEAAIATKKWEYGVSSERMMIERVQKAVGTILPARTNNLSSNDLKRARIGVSARQRPFRKP